MPNDKDEFMTDELNLNLTGKLKTKYDKGFTKKFDSLKIKYKKDPKKFIIAFVAITLVLSTLVGTTLAFSTLVSKTDNSVKINSGTIVLSLEESENFISLSNQLPMKDEKGLMQDKDYTFTVKNTGNIDANYKVVLENTCVVGAYYKQNGKNVMADKCVLDEFINVGLKKNNESYTVIKKGDFPYYVIDSGTLSSNQIISYSMKLWLSEDTPNTFNAKDGKNIIYSSKIKVMYEQVS